MNGNHGRCLEMKLIRAVLLLVFEETPHSSNAKKEEMPNQLKLLDRNDTENKIQKARHEEEYVSPNDGLADSDSVLAIPDQKKEGISQTIVDMITWMRY